MQKIPVYKEGGIAVFGERTIFQSPVILRKGLLECLLWSDPKNRGDEDVELISIIRMSPGLDLEIRKNDEGIRGVKFYKPNGDLLEFAPFSDSISPMAIFWSLLRFRRMEKVWNVITPMITLPSILQTTTGRPSW